MIAMRLLFILSIFCHSLFGTHAYIGHSKCGGRFGDQLLHYLHAKWLSYQYDIPLFYHPFPYSAALQLDAIEPHLGSPTDHGLTPYLIRHKFPLNPASHFLYECPYFPALEEEQREGYGSAFPVDWKDPTFRQMALHLIAPKHPLPLTLPPEGTLSIAIHVREGGGFDTDHTRLYDPLKLPPLHFYIEALSQCLAQFPDEKIYCHLFTDAVSPSTIAEAFQPLLAAHPLLTLHYRAEGNHHTKNVLEDFFSLFHFDILIRPRSNFSIVPQLLHDYKLVYYPAAFLRTDQTIQITQIGVIK